MKTQRFWTNVRKAFEVLFDLDGGAREEARGRIEDADVRAEVAGMLRSLDEMYAFLEQPPRISPAMIDAEPYVGKHVGPYRLLREIGHGGLGAVFLGRRDNGVYRRDVAIKLLWPHGDADEDDGTYGNNGTSLKTVSGSSEK